jgi:cell division protein FtsL
MKQRRPRQVKSKVYNYRVAARRRHPGSSRWIHAVIALALIAVAAGIIYVWQRNRLLHMSYTIRTLRREVEALDKAQTGLEADIGELKTPTRIRRLVHERGLGLVPASSDQIVHLTEPDPVTLAQDDEPRRPIGRRLWDAIMLGER